MSQVKSKEEIEIMREGGKILHLILREVAKKVIPGTKTIELNNYTEQLIEKYGVKASFKDYRGFPTALCTSVNNEVVHGIPSETVLKEGDIIGLDLGIWHKNLCTDSAITVAVGKIDANTQFFLETIEKSLNQALKIIRAGTKIGDIGACIQKFVEKRGYSPVRDCVGHGVGKTVHEEPDIPNYGQRGTGVELKAGMTVAIEPIVNMGHFENYVKNDNWTIATKDGSMSAQFEHTIAITEKGCDILT